MQFVFVEFWVTLKIILYCVSHRLWHFIFCIEVQQTDCTFQFNNLFSEKSCNLRVKIDNASVAFFKVREYKKSIGVEQGLPQGTVSGLQFGFRQ